MGAVKSSKRIGELLLERRYITSVQLEQALAQQRSTGQFLGAILLKAGAVTAEQLLEVFSEQFGIPWERLDLAQVDWSLAKQFPASTLSGGQCFPIRADQQSVTVAIINPLDAWGMSGIERAAGLRKVKPVLVLEQDLRTVLQEHKRQALATLEARLNYGTDQAE